MIPVFSGVRVYLLVGRIDMRRERERHIGRRRPLILTQCPLFGVPPNVVLAASVAGQPQLVEHPLIRQPLALGLVHVR